jgi:hypothetical protein
MAGEKYGITKFFEVQVALSQRPHNLTLLGHDKAAEGLLALYWHHHH